MNKNRFMLLFGAMALVANQNVVCGGKKASLGALWRNLKNEPVSTGIDIAALGINIAVDYNSDKLNLVVDNVVDRVSKNLTTQNFCNKATIEWNKLGGSENSWKITKQTKEFGESYLAPYAPQVANLLAKAFARAGAKTVIEVGDNRASILGAKFSNYCNKQSAGDSEPKISSVPDSKAIGKTFKQRLKVEAGFALTGMALKCAGNKLIEKGLVAEDGKLVKAVNHAKETRIFNLAVACIKEVI